MSSRVIVSRHPAAIEFVAAQLGREAGCQAEYIPAGSRVEFYVPAGTYPGPDFPTSVPVLTQATPDDVRGRVVYGNLPMHLAALAAEVHVIEFEGTPPRGQEYTLADMVAAGAVIRQYKVLDRAGVESLQTAAHADGYGPPPWCLLHFADEPNPHATGSAGSQALVIK